MPIEVFFALFHAMSYCVQKRNRNVNLQICVYEHVCVCVCVCSYRLLYMYKPIFLTHIYTNEA
jgi:hypothetical protein